MTIRRLDDPVTRERLKRSQLEWGVIMNIAHGYPPNPFPPPNMPLEFHSRHQRVKDDIDDGTLPQVFPGKPAWKGTKIQFSALDEYAKKKAALDPTGYHWLVEFCEVWREVLSEMPGAAKKRRRRKKDSLEESRLQDQHRHIVEKFKRLPPGLTPPKQAEALANDRSIGLSASTLLQMIRGDYPPWVARGWAGLQEYQRR